MVSTWLLKPYINNQPNTLHESGINVGTVDPLFWHFPIPLGPYFMPISILLTSPSAENIGLSSSHLVPEIIWSNVNLIFNKICHLTFLKDEVQYGNITLFGLGIDHNLEGKLSDISIEATEFTRWKHCCFIIHKNLQYLYLQIHPCVLSTLNVVLHTFCYTLENYIYS